MTKDLGFMPRLRLAALSVLLLAAPSFAQGTLTRVFAVPSDTIAGNGALYTLSFQTSVLGSINGTGLPANGRIRVTFDSTFTDSTISAAFNVYGVTGGYDSIKVVNHKVTLYRDGTGAALAAGDSAKLHLAIVYNSTLADTFQLFVETLNDTGAVIDTAKTAPFRITVGPLHHFAIDSVGTQTVGVPFSVTLSARDEHENLVTKFKRYVIFSANQGVVEPDTSALFVNGALTDTVFLNIAGAGRILNVRDTLNHVGASNPFLLNPGPLHHFSVSTIPSPQTAGVSFPVTFTAQDTFNNTVTSFANTATLSATTGTPTPITTGVFTAGVRNESVALNLAATSDTLIVSASGKSGRSNAFAVNVGGLHHFHFNAIAGQTAGNSFNVTITAHDANHNTVTSFSSSVTLSDNTGSLAPTASGAFVAGVRTLSVSITKASASVAISANDGSGHLGQSDNFAVTHDALDHFKVTNTSDANIASQTAGLSFNIKIIAQDAFDNTVLTHTGAGSAVTLANTTASLLPPTTSTFTNGVLASQSVSIGKVASADIITATHGVSGKSGVSNTFAVGHGSLNDFRIANVATPQTAGAPIPLVITAIDGNDNTVTSFAGTVNLSVSGGGTITPSVSGNFVNGVWNGSVTISNAGNNRVISASDGTRSENSNTFNVSGGALDHFVIDAITNKVAGANFSVTVRAQDANGNDVAHTGTVTLSDNTGTLTASSLGFTGQTALTINDANITKAQSGVVLTASGSGKVGQSNGFNVTHAGLDHFKVTNTAGGNIASQQAGTSFNLRLEAQDAFNNTVLTHTGAGSAVTLANTTTSIAPITSGNFTNGVLASQSATITKTANADAITATHAGSGKSGASNTFAVNHGAQTDFRIDPIASPQVAGSPFSVVIKAVDGNENIVTSFGGTVTLSISGGGAVTPNVSGNFIAGVWSGSVAVSTTGNNRVLTVSNGSFSEPSNAFDVNAGGLASFVLDAITDKTAGQNFSVTVRAKDANGNDFLHSGTVTLTDNTGTLTPTSLNFSNQAAVTISNANITKAQSGVVITANGSNRLGQSNNFNVTHAGLSQFAVKNTSGGNIASQQAGTSFNIRIEAQDAFDNIVATHTGAGSAVAISNTTSSITPLASGAFTNGVLAAQTVTITKTASADAITVNGGSPASTGVSNSFAVSAGPLNDFRIANISTPQISGSPIPLIVTAVDANENTVTSFAGTVNISVSGGGVITPSVSGNFIGGVWSNSATISNTGNNRVITVTDGTRNESSNVFNVVSGSLAEFVISAITDKTAGENFSVSVTARDANGNNVAHTGTVTLSDNTGTLIASPLVFNNQVSQTINDARITKALANTEMYASGSGKTSKSNTFAVNHAALDHFVVTNTSNAAIAAQTAGTAFNIKIVAQDTFGNIATSFNQFVTITDLTNVNFNSGNFMSGVLSSQSVTINQTRSDNQLTVVGGAPSKTGASNLFNVNSGALNGFTIDTISDQATGSPFTITIRARDAQNNLKTDFTGTVTISDLTGTITPTTSAAFIGGVAKESVTITQPRNANTITVTSAGRQGVSNAFNVQALTIDRFEISAVGNLTAGVQFSLTLIARDANNNPVTSFTGNVTLSDLSGSIAPATSNNFSSGVLTQNFTITKSFTNDRITVTGVGRSNSSNTFNVTHAALAKFFIPTITDQTAGASFPLSITAQDQYDNTVTSFANSVTIEINTGTIEPTTSGAFLAGAKTVSVTIPQAGNNRIITVRDASNKVGVTNSFNVSASGLAKFVFTTIGTQTAGAPFSFTITARDQNDNDVVFNGTVTLADATGTLSQTSVPMNGTSVTVSNVTITKAQSGVFITANGGGKTGQSVLFNVNAAGLHRVRVVEGNSGDGVELGAKTLDADKTLSVHAAGYDLYNNYVGEQSVNWSVFSTASVIGVVSPSANVAATTFEAQKTGTGRIVANHASAIDDSTGLITITDGAPYSVKILFNTSGETNEVNTLSLTTGATQDVHAASFDRDDNYIQDVSANWSVTGNIGSLSQNTGVTTRFTAVTKGNGQINATSAGLLSDATGTITVTEGTLAKIRIVEGEGGPGNRFLGRNVPTHDNFTLHAAGYDASDNYLGDFAVNWIAVNGRGVFSRTFDTSTVFDPQTPGDERIRADYPSATVLDDSTNLFNISTGVAVRIKVLRGATGNTEEAQDVPLTTGEFFDFHASSFDGDNNRIGDVNVTWRLSSVIGNLSSNFGKTTRFTATTAGNTVLTATDPLLGEDATGTISVASGALTEIRIVRGPGGTGGPRVGSLNLTTDDVLQVHAAGYDANNNYLDDYEVDWRVSNGIGVFEVTRGKVTTLTLTRPGTGKIFADHVSAPDDSTGNLIVSTGALHHIKILAGATGLTSIVEDDTLTTDENLPVHAGGFDADDNHKGDVSVAWSITGTTIGTLSSLNGTATTLNPNKVGVGAIRAVHASAGSDLTGSITVEPGNLAAIRIAVGQTGNRAALNDTSMSTDDFLTMHVAGYDNDGNYIRDESVTWTSAGLTPAVNATGTTITFQPTLAPSSGLIRATHATVGFDETGTISARVGRLHHVVVLSGPNGEQAPQGDVTLQPGQTLQVHAGGFDAKNNYIQDEIVNWSLDGSNGNLSASSGFSTIFTAVRANQTSSIRATHTNAAIAGDNSGVIDVREGNVNSIVLRTAPNNGGAVFNTLTMSADDEVTIYAASYDVGGNYIGDRTVTWTNTGGLLPTVNATGSSFVFAPDRGAAGGSINGTIVGTFAPGINDATGLITVNPGAPSGVVTLTPVRSGLPADGVSTTQITSTAILDAEGNNVGANRRFTVAVVPPTYGDITDSDVDPVAPGKQINTNAQGQLVFTFRAGTTGGIATVNVNSGLASGSTQITLGSLNIVSVSTNNTTVTRGQSAILVNMVVQNLGAATIQNLAGGLTFFGTQDRTPDYIVNSSLGNPASIAGNTQETLSFEVEVRNTAALETVQINGQVSGTVNGSQVSDNDAGNKDSWTVLRPAALSLVSVATSAPDTVAAGTTNLPVTVRIANNLALGGSSSAVIDSVRLRFSQGPLDKTNEYVVAPDPNNPTSLVSGATSTFNFIVNINQGATLGLTTIDAVAYGRDANSNAATQDLSADATDRWFVIESNSFRIVAITPSQETVTAGMSKPWQIKMKVQNLAASSLTLDLAPSKTFVRLRIGAVEVTPTLAYPTQLDEGGTVLAGNAMGTLTFVINQTGIKDGVAAISGFAQGKDAGGFDVFANTNNGGGGEVNIQTPGTMEIREALIASQTSVTAGQTQQWTVTARVTNTGQSTVKLLHRDSTFINIGNNVNYLFNKPTRFLDGDSLLEQGETKSLVITVTKTGEQFSTQSLPISVSTRGTELNSNRKVISTTGNGTVLTQSPARLVIKSVRASQSLVTAGQTRAWQVFVVVENTGESQVAVKVDTSTNLRFRLGNQFQAGYNATLNPQVWLGKSSIDLAGNSTDSLRFNIAATGTNPGVVQLWAKVEATESNSNAKVVATDNATSVTVQAQPNIAYIPQSLEPKTPNLNSLYAFKVKVKNNGSATLGLIASATRLLFNDGSVSFIARVDANFNLNVPANDTTLLTFVNTAIPANMRPGKYPVTVELRGIQNNNGFTQNLLLSDSVQVTVPGQLQVVSMRASQPTVTRQMQKDWFLMMAVKNNGGFAVALDSARVQLLNGQDVTREFNIVRPTRFSGSNTVMLQPQATDSLRFEIRDTGIKLGPTTVIGSAWLTDQSNQNKLQITSDGNSGGFVVQSPAELQIVSLDPSQESVTRNQTRPWFVDMNVKNIGESDVRVDFSDTLATRLDLSSPNGYQIKYPTAFLGGGNVLGEDETRVLRFEITKTGSATVTNTITGKVRGVELNSGELRNDDTQSGGGASVKVEAEARLRISEVALRKWDATPNLPNVNLNQRFYVQTLVENRGEEDADSVLVRLQSDGSSGISEPQLFIQGGVNGGLFNSAIFEVTASNAENARETFTATIVSAKARNTGSNVPIDNPQDDSEFAIVQRPAGLYITNVLTSKPEVPAQDNRAWYIYVVVQDTGGASVVLNDPHEADITITIEGEKQEDYTIVAPSVLAIAGNLILRGGQTDTLVYTVTSTGDRGGLAVLEASLGWKDQNNNQVGSASMNGQLNVTTTATVQIQTTTLKDVFNTFRGTNVGLVNINQSFGLEVLVDNRSLVEDVETVVLELTTDGNSQIQNARQIITRIPQREQRTVRFDIVAASAPTVGDVKEIFTARILEATASRGGPADILNSLDPTDEVRIELPAQLSLGIAAEFENLTTNQLFKVSALVTNRANAAEVDEQGKVLLLLPPDFKIEEPRDLNERSFKVGESVIWQVRAPDYPTSATLSAKINARPHDRNSRTEALVAQEEDDVEVEVVQSDLRIIGTLITSPEGAQDSMLSTFQTFRIVSQISYSRDLTGDLITLELPANTQYAFRAGSRATQNFKGLDSIFWDLQAPPSPVGPRTFRVNARGKAGTGADVIDEDVIQLQTVQRALIRFTAEVVKPGAADTLSAGQSFKLRATVSNRGVAGVLDSIRVRLQLGQTGVSIPNEPEVKVLVINGPSGFVEWNAFAPSTPTPPSDLRVQMLNLPRDENSYEEAAWDDGVEQFVQNLTVRTVEPGTVFVVKPAIVSPLGATDDTLSTLQEFTVQAAVQARRLASVNVELKAPNGYEFVNLNERIQSRSALNREETFAWKMKAPTSALAAQPFYVTLRAFDENETKEIFGDSDSLFVTVVARADLSLEGEIASPGSVRNDAAASTNQLFFIKATITNNGTAQAVGADSIKLELPAGYSTTEPLVKSSTSGVVLWQIKARNRPSTGPENILVRLVKRPTDENSDQPAVVSTDRATIAIRTEDLRLSVRSASGLNGGPVARKQENVVLMALELRNEGSENSSGIVLKAVKFYAQDKEGQDLAPNAAIKRLRVIESSAQKELGRLDNITATNPLSLTFAVPDTITGGALGRINVVVDVVDNASVSNFYLGVRTGEDITAQNQDEPFDPVPVVLEAGALVSEAAVLFEDQFDKSFYNYPNPFAAGSGDKERGETKFNYYLPQDSDVDFRIFTLLGELVYAVSYQATDPQGRAGSRSETGRGFITWDGRNGNNKVVLNGVYLAVLKTSAGTVMTKVAVVK